VLTETSAEERALKQLRLIFDSIDANEDDKVSKPELTAALQRDEYLGALIKEAGMNDVFLVLNQLDTSEDHFISWDEFRIHLQVAAVQEVEVLGYVVAAELPAEEKALEQLKALFDSLDANEDGTVNKKELAAGLSRSKAQDVLEGHGKCGALGQLLHQAGLNPEWHVLQHLDTNMDGRITWEEFEKHLRCAAEEVILEEAKVAPRQSFWGCC